MKAPDRPKDDEERVTALRELGVLDTPAEERFDRVTRLCQRLFGVPMAFVNLVDRDRLYIKSVQGADMGQIPRDESMCGHAILDPAGIVVEDTSLDDRFHDNPSVTGNPNIRFYAGVPLAAPGGQRVGTLCIADTAPRSLTDADRALLADLALWVEKELNLDDEFDRAAEVQRAMFPTRELSARGWEVSGACQPSREVSGDFYDWFRTLSGPVITLGDVMGKGMSAAIVTASVRSAIRAGAGRADLGEGLQSAALSLADDLDATGTFATAVVARLDEDGTAWLADAGHGHTVHVQASGRIDVHEDGGLPLGIDVGEAYWSKPIELDDGDLLVLHSDGLLEFDGGPATSGEVGELVRGSLTAREAVDRLLDVCDRARQSDDVTMLVAMRRA